MMAASPWLGPVETMSRTEEPVKVTLAVAPALVKLFTALVLAVLEDTLTGVPPVFQMLLSGPAPCGPGYKYRST